ncbi:MAG: glycosyltransferase family 2 protein [Ilumatobacter sp.]|nr:glycosyltransferase family 2 protein [Ilumatobacter sp.]
MCTRNRDDVVAKAVGAALRGHDERLRLIVIDQNDDDRVVEALRPFADDQRLRHVRLDRPGAGRARNVALSQTDAEVVCFTDDDCLVPESWATTMTGLVRSDPTVAMVFCDVIATADDDAADGYTPMHLTRHHGPIRSWDHHARADLLGIGAGMAIRRQAILDLGGFDPVMGPGATFPSADDREMAIRALLGGHAVVNTAETAVIHLGFRAAGSDARAHSKRDHVAVGAMFAKFWRLRPARTTAHVAAFLLASGAHVLADSWRSRRPSGVGKLWWTVVGLWRGARHPKRVDPTVYVDNGPEAVLR